MPLQCSLLQRELPLTNTKNTLLQETESVCKRKYFGETSAQKRRLTTSFSLGKEHLTVNKFLGKPNVVNKFLSTHNKFFDKPKVEKQLLTTESFPDSVLYDCEEKFVAVLKRKKKYRAAAMAPCAYSVPMADPPELGCDIQERSYPQNSNLITPTYSLCSAPKPALDIFGSAPQSMTLLQLRKIPVRSGSLRGQFDSGIQKSRKLHKMPAYHFQSLPFKQCSEPHYKPLEEDSALLLKNQLKEMKRMKLRLLNAVSTSLLSSPQFKEPNDSFRDYLLKCATDVVALDPEFILKVALYARQELNIRSTTNFLLAFAASENSCRPFLKKYFEASIVLPTDWIAVAEMYLVFNPDIQPRFLPAALRKVMKSSFTKFDTYQLAKYNKKKKSKKDKEGTSDAEIRETTNKLYSLKQLIRQLHITSPVEHIMPILGKKYPNDPESFRQQGLPGTWNSENAGKRMKLPVPETWETAVSAGGNKAKVWESLIDNSKLPYMATLRNLRNLIMAGISEEHHAKVQARLSRKDAVIKSRQFPLRFYAAFKVLDDIEKLCDRESRIMCDISETSPKKPAWKVRQKAALLSKVENITFTALEKYKKSLSTALEISANHNLDPIGGRTLVVSDLTDNYSPAGGGAAEFFNMKFHSCILLSLMCLKACEECEVKAILMNNTIESFELKSKLFLENMSELCHKYQSPFVGSVDLFDSEDEEEMFCVVLYDLFEHYFKPQALLHRKLDNVIFLKSREHQNDEKIVSGFLHKYRNLVNSNLLYIQVDLSVDAKRANLPTSSDENNIYLAGFSEHIFKFISERSNGGQLAHVESIDKKYDLMKKHGITYSEDSLKDSSLTYGQKIPIYSRVPKWRTARIFISSTFRDMHGERDLLLRYVFPELKTRAASLFVKINEIDLRWGISETDAMSNKSHQMCLIEAQNCDFFIGIIGERYGNRCRFDGDLDPRLSWVHDVPSESSITELETLCGALNRESFREKAFFFIRNSAFISQVPPKWKECFEPEDSNSEERLRALKEQIRSSGMAIFDWYPCHFAGVYEEKPVVAGLDAFGQAVLNNLWNAISKFYKKDVNTSVISEEEICQEMLASSCDNFIGEQNSPLNWVMKELKKRTGIFCVTGKPGCGKTAFITRVLKEMKGSLVIPYFIGASSQSADLSYMLCYIGNSILSKLPVDISVPNTKESLLNNFSDIILEGSKASFPGTLFLFIDGLDYLDIEAQTLDWLPYDMPQGFKLICSTSDSSEAYRSLLKREKTGCPVHFVPMKPLVVTDRQQLVRYYLKQHGKALDESPFNNQMLQLVTKLDSGNPLYLQVACDYLKTFAVFENLMQKLQTFPSMLSQVLEEIIFQTEKSHGAGIVQSALTLMCIVKEGLEDNEMHILLSIANPEIYKNSSAVFVELVKEITSLQPECMIPPVNFCSLVHMLKTFAYPFGNLSHGTLRLASKEFAAVVMKYYSKSNYITNLSYFHRLVAAYYFTICDPKGNKSWIGTSNTAFCGLLCHLLYGKCYAELTEFLCCLDFLQGAFNVNAGEELPEYYNALVNLDIARLGPVSIDKLEDYGNFVNHNMHVLKSWPFLIRQQARNEPVDSYVFKECIVQEELILECVTRSSESLKCRPKTLAGFAKSIICVKSHEFNPIAALGSSDGSAKILNMDTGKILSSLRGHSSSITSVCFVGRDRVCLSSADNTLSIWSYSENYRIAVLEGHTRFISSCCCDPQGDIVSSAWDCTIRFWSSHDGRAVSCIDTIKCPVNSVAHHPEQQQVACGLWNKTIEIWDALLLSKISTLHGHSSSVQCVVYSTSGVHLLSSSLDSEVFIWSTNECLKIAKLDAHTSFVRSISCSAQRSYVVTASDDTTLKVWPDEEQAVKMTIQEFKTHPIQFMEIVSQLCLAVAFRNSTLRVFDLVDGHVVAKLDTASDPVSCFSKFNGRENQQGDQPVDRSIEVLVFGTKSGKAMELKFENSSVVEVACLNSCMTVMYHTDSLVFCGTTNGDLAVLSFDNTVPHGILYAAHQNTVTALSVSSVGMYGLVLSVSADMTSKLWEFGKTGEKGNLAPRLKTTYECKHKDHMTSCYLYQIPSSSKEKNVMVTGSYDNTVVIWNDEKDQVLTGLKTSISGVYYSGKFIVAYGSEGSVIVWSPKGKCVSIIPGIEKSSAVIAFHFQKGKTHFKDFDATLAFVENDGSISIRKPFQRSPLCTLQGHGHSITSCDINRDNVILSCSSDKTVNIWKVPKSITPNAKVYHSGKIKSVAVSQSGNLALSGDEYGNIILWQISDQQEKCPMKYITQKQYIGGNIAAVRWMQNDKVICAGQVQSRAKENHFVEILICKSSAEKDSSSFLLQVQQQRNFTSEITSVDYLLSMDTVAVGLKSGKIFLMNSKVREEMTVANDWVLKVKLSVAVDPMVYIVRTNGMIQQFAFAALCKSKVKVKEEINVFPEAKSWITALNCASEGTFYVGDVSGRMSAYNINTGPIVTKQAHMASISDICITDDLLFTCSLDRTVKVWDPHSLKQLSQFHCQSPISCLAIPEGMWSSSTMKSLCLTIGTTDGDVHLLRLTKKKLQVPASANNTTGFDFRSVASFSSPKASDNKTMFSGRNITELVSQSPVPSNTVSDGSNISLLAFPPLPSSSTAFGGTNIPFGIHP